MYEFEGEVVKVYPTKPYGTKGRVKRELRVKEMPEGKFANVVPFYLKGDRCSVADNLREGDGVKISFVLEGNVWDKRDGTEPKCFCSNICLKLEKTSEAPANSNDGQTAFDQDQSPDEMPF